VRALFGLGAVARAATPVDSVGLRILAVGALNGQLEPATAGSDRPIGGVVALKSSLERMSAGCDCPVIRLAAGDLLEGSRGSDLVHGQSMVEALNRLGLAATAVGATDLDWSPDTLRRRMAGSRFPWVTANVVDSLSRRPAAWAVPYRVVTAAGRKVAVVGYTAPRLGAVPNGSASDLATVRGLDGIKDALAAARTERPDFVIVLANADGPELAAALPAGSIDGIVTTGAGIDTVINGIAVLGGAPGGATVAAVDLVRTVVGGRMYRRQVDTVWADQPKPDSAETAILARYRPMVDSLGRQVTAQVKLPLSRQAAQSPLGNLVADAWRNALRTDIAIVADSELLTDLPAGPVTFDALRNFIGPYTLIGLRSISGRALKQFLDNALAAGRPQLHVAGLTVIYDAAAATGRRIKEVRLPDGSKLRDNPPYTVAATAKVLLPDARPATLGPGGRRALDALATYLRALPQPVEAPEQPRLTPKH
jgi:2',3'-cyclic-nucleotide 2'-phosphodiesterase (5'-nucleotidase family)